MKHLQINAERFAIFKDELTRGYENFFLEAPYQHSAYYMAYALCEKRWTCDDRLREIETLSMEEVKSAIPAFLSTMHIEGLVHGNLERDQVIHMFKQVEEVLNPRALLPSQFIGERSVILPQGRKFVHALPVRDRDDVNSAINYNCQVCDVRDVKLRNRLSLTAQITQEPCFNQLRTREQLGYLVFSGVRRQLGQLDFRLIIQSERDPTYLENRVLEFLESLREIITNMTETEYQSQVDSLIAERLEKFKNLWEEGSKYWTDIESGYYEFDEVKKDVDELKTITKESLLEFFDAYILPNSKSGSTFSIHLQSQKPPSDKKEEESNFRVEQLYPVLVYLKLVDKTQLTEDQLKTLVSEHGGDNTIQSSAGLAEFLETKMKLDKEGAEQVVLKMKQGPEGLSERDHTQLPANAIRIDDLNYFKRRMPLSVAAVPFYAFANNI